MADEETLQKREEDSDSDAEDEDIVDDVPKIDIDPSKLTPLSPEVISKQVSYTIGDQKGSRVLTSMKGYNKSRYALL